MKRKLNPSWPLPVPCITNSSQDTLHQHFEMPMLRAILCIIPPLPATTTALYPSHSGFPLKPSLYPAHSDLPFVTLPPSGHPAG